MYQHKPLFINAALYDTSMHPRANPSLLLSLFRIFLASLTCLFFHVNFRLSESTSKKFHSVFFIDIKLNIKVNLKTICIFTPLNLLIDEQGMYFHLLFYLASFLLLLILSSGCWCFFKVQLLLLFCFQAFFFKHRGAIDFGS